MADSIMATMKKATESGKVFQCNYCDAVCGDRYRVKCTMAKDVCMGRDPVDGEKIIIPFCSDSCTKKHVLANDLKNARILLNLQTEMAKRTLEMLRSLKQMKERDLEHEEEILMIWRSSIYAIKLFQACLDREPVQRLISLKDESLKSFGDVLELIHEDSQMMEVILKRIKLIQDLNLSIIGS
jgi:hypothetical protein